MTAAVLYHRIDQIVKPKDEPKKLQVVDRRFHGFGIYRMASQLRSQNLLTHTHAHASDRK